MRRAGLTVVCLSLARLPGLFLGCSEGGKEIGPTGGVEGTVMLDGSPLSDGSIALYDKSTGNTGGGTLGPGGKFKFTVPVPVGTYQVSFQPPEAFPPDDPAADKMANQAQLHQDYLNGDTSGIVAEVKEGPNTFTFELKKAGPKG